MIIDEKDFISFLTVKQGLPKSTIRFCVIRLRAIKRWLVDKDLTKENVERFFFYLKELGRKNSTLNTYRFTFRHIQDYLLDRGIDNKFFDSFTSFPKSKQPIYILTPDEIEKILSVDQSYGRFYNIPAVEATKRINSTHPPLKKFP